MKFSELEAAFEAYTGIVGEIDSADMAVWFNDAQLDLALDFGIVQSATVEANEDSVAIPPADCIKVIGSNAEYTFNELGYLYFGSPGSYTIYYRSMPVPFTGTDPDAVSVLPHGLHHLMAMYAAAMYWFRESEGDTEEMNLGEKWLQRYYMDKQALLNKLDRAGGSNLDRWRVID